MYLKRTFELKRSFDEANANSDSLGRRVACKTQTLAQIQAHTEAETPRLGHMSEPDNAIEYASMVAGVVDDSERRVFNSR